MFLFQYAIDIYLYAGESYLIFRFPEFPQSTLGEKHPWDD